METVGAEVSGWPRSEVDFWRRPRRQCFQLLDQFQMGVRGHGVLRHSTFYFCFKRKPMRVWACGHAPSPHLWSACEHWT